MKMIKLIMLLCFTATTISAQLKDMEVELPENLVGKWVMVSKEPGIGSRSIYFYSDGIINFDDVKTKRVQVQRYQVSKSASGYRVNILELVTHKPISKFNILFLKNDGMEVTFGNANKLSYAKFKKIRDGGELCNFPLIRHLFL
jgi:hypothetical protein